MATTRRGLSYAAAIVAIGGVLRVAGPPARTPVGGTSAEIRTANSAAAGQAASASRETHKAADSVKKSGENDGGKTDIHAYQKGLTSAVEDFCNAPEVKFNGAGCSSAHFVIATLPDPAHTHLALLFDRDADAIQQAAQGQGYIFERAILPWAHGTQQQNSDPQKRHQEDEERKEKESHPGLMIFRLPPSSQPDHPTNRRGRNRVTNEDQGRGPLFIFIVGESPTGGIRKVQFHDAMSTIAELRHTLNISEQSRLILGPSFSGSFESLKGALRGSGSPPTFVYSGTATKADGIRSFGEPQNNLHFASFQENDTYIRQQFIQFVCSNDYSPGRIAVLSEEETQFGQQASNKPASSKAEVCESDYPNEPLDLLYLHFPREISYFRSAYQKEAAVAQQQKNEAKLPGASVLHLDSDDTGKDDDSVSPYAATQNALSQEAIMLGILASLQKHHIAFTVLYATDPADQLFLARYLRAGYPQGRVVITDPDLLFGREPDPLLRGVMAVSAYALVPGMDDRLCASADPADAHEDQLFVSGLSLGIFNAMTGLLSVDAQTNQTWRDALKSGLQTLPPAPYYDYSAPWLLDQSGSMACSEKPLLWLTTLGRDGFWTVAGITSERVVSADPRNPVAFQGGAGDLSTLLPASHGPNAPKPPSEKKGFYKPGVWKIACAICIILMLAHCILSFSGSMLADSEAKTQFASTDEWRGASIVALGALSLATAFIMIMFAASPESVWSASGADLSDFWQSLRWVILVAFVFATLWDLGRLRGQPWVATAFAIALFLSFFWQVIAWYPLPLNRAEAWANRPHWFSTGWMCELVSWLDAERLNVYWSNRILNLSSGLSPAFPILMLLAGGYWWMWHSLRGITLVDLRRPRLPSEEDLGPYAFRLGDAEAEQLRMDAHPFVFTWQIWLIILALLAIVCLTVLNLDHPVQTMEGMAYDRGYALLLGLMIAAFLSCLFKCVYTWMKCRQILAALDRLPLREAFSRMKRLTWHSMWNPGGSTFRETYKLMARGAENLTRLKAQIQDWRTPMSDSARRTMLDQIDVINGFRHIVFDIRGLVVDEKKQPKPTKAITPSGDSFVLSRTLSRIRSLAPTIKSLPGKLRSRYVEYCERRANLVVLMKVIGDLQSEMAKLSAKLMTEVLKPLWDEETSPVLSEDEASSKTPLPPLRILAEEYAALTYLNFLITVLLRMRTFVMCAAGIYVFIVLSTSVYPFEPHPALQTLAIVLLVVMGVFVAYVYAEMHRESILGRLTSKEGGELGWDFWLKLAAAGAIPLFSLIAVQFPGISQVLFSWLEPALEAVK